MGSVVYARARLHDLHPMSLDSGALWQRQPQHRQLATFRNYEQFLYRIYQIQRHYLLGSKFLSACILVVVYMTGPILIPLFLLFGLSGDLSRGSGEDVDVIAYILLVLFAISASYLLLWAPRAPAERLSFLSAFGGTGPLGKTQRYGLIDGILSRKAQDPKDKAFAMWAVLQRFFAETLPTPNYSLSIGQIYKQLTIYLVHATGSLDVLLPAAQSSFPGQPSWVPNWSQDDHNFWRSPPLVCAFSKQGDHRQNTTQGQLLEPPSHIHQNITQDQQLWRLDSENIDTLSVQAFPFQTIISCYLFQRTSNIYLECEAAVHLKNLQTMLEIFRKPVVMYMESFQDQILFLVSAFEAWLGIEKERFSAQKMYRWCLFFSQLSQSPPLEVFSLLSRETNDSPGISSSQSYHVFQLSEVFRSQIRICNALARLEKSLFVTDGQTLWINGSSLGRELSLSGGIGTKNVRAGDKILVVPGISCLLVIRQDSDSTRLISPAIVYTANSSKKDWP